eukprot:scaffold4471_cov238-Prasinococcus_capsulatus_cf.AAC.4
MWRACARPGGGVPQAGRTRADAGGRVRVGCRWNAARAWAPTAGEGDARRRQQRRRRRPPPPP